MRKILSALGICVVVLLLVPFGLAQSPTGSINGTVLDPSGAAVSGATVTITNVATNEVHTTTTDSQGRYILNFVQPSTYTVTASAPGFQTAKQEGILVQITVGSPVNFNLPVAQVSQKVEVASTTPPLQTSTATLSTVVTGRMITDLPLNGRNPTSLEVLVPGVNTTGNASTPHIAGSRNANNEEQIDGMTNILPENNVGNNSTAYTPIVDSVQEFSVQTSVLPASYGRFSGGVISLLTRSGTNALHGSIFDFTQTNALYAKPFFSSGPIPSSHLYQYGGTVGGPIFIPHVYNGHNKSFFFFAFEDSKQSTAVTDTYSVPTAAERMGDFTALGTTIYNPYAVTQTTDSKGNVSYTRSEFPTHNLIPANLQSKVGLAALSYYPMPNTPSSNGFNNYTHTGANVNNYYHFDIRLDHDFGSKVHSFVRFSHINNPSTPVNDYGNAANPTGNGPQISTAYSASVDNTIILSPSLILDLRGGFSRSAVTRMPYGEPFNVQTNLGLPASIQQNGQINAQVFPYFQLSNGYSSLGSGNYVPFQENPSAVDINPSIVKVIHGNSISIGGEWRKLFLNFYQYGYPTGQFGNIGADWTEQIANNPALPNGNAFATMALGLADYGQITTDTTLATSSAYGAAYIEDDYQAAKNLTFNLGLRWDVDIPRTERHNKLDYWDPTLPSPIAGLVPASACLYCGNLMGQMVFVGTKQSKYGRHQGPTQWKDFGPRIGFAWSPDGNTVVRGGYGIVYAASALQAAGTSGGAGTDGFTTNTNLPFGQTNQQSVYLTYDNPVPNGLNLPQGVAGGPGTFLGQGIGDTFFDSYHNPYSIQANLSVQRALPGNTVVTAGYIYNAGHFLINGDPGVPFSQVNPSYLSLGSKLIENVPNPFYGIITTPGSTLSAQTIPYDYLLKAFPQYSSVMSYRKADSGSHYNAFTLKVDKRYSHGLSVLLAFTASKLMDNSAAAVSYLGPSSQTYADQFNPKAEFGLSSQDISRTLVIGYTYELPFGRGRQFLGDAHGVTNELISGWQTNGIISLDTGTPVVLAATSTNTGLLGLGQRPDEAPGDPRVPNQNRNQWFNINLFKAAPNFTIGNAPRVLPNVRVPGYADADLSAFKNNYIGASRRFNLQFRFEAFNALNHPVFNGPDANVGDCNPDPMTGACTGNYGKITPSQGQSNTGREIQLAVKFIY